ncbi:peptidoglycan DD-metalloendopeptidase family protein [Pseudohaliea rubra]|uniref:Lipoprotein NlpD n=1 Tax=Pseudohaliea rubra DSM 19751 TaxID=1265313 RepID=A0A095VUC2_9GAMM|nr:peptidoglycan DD-metalloendopeptidase family protein [Pseudohaliea rubra]KGE05042.1 Lipoprotein NlpD [Pseudohaliea rubra DSM 19751]
MGPGRGSAALAAVLGLLLGLAACGGNPPAPIEDRGAAGGIDRAGRYTVASGDTLYSIAFRFGLDFRGLAAANGIAAPYTIYPGQRLALKTSPAPAAQKTARPPVPREVATATPRVTPKAASRATAPAPPPRPTAAKVSDAPVASWRWPAAGKVARGFSSTVHKGIDIAGAKGDPVRASAAGSVVYAGAGIAGYGQLLIVRHNPRFLSAYGHNDRLLVGEGEPVAAGQRIATRGSSGTDSVKLHFEIRRDGKPVDPLSLLPKR